MTGKRVYLTVQAFVCALAAALLVAAAIGLYREGTAVQKETGDLFYYIYTWDKAGARLAPLLPLIYGALGMTAAGWILGVRDENADKPARNEKISRDLICARVRNASPAMKKERSRQNTLKTAGGIAFGLCMVPLTIYIMNGANFGRPLDTAADLLALLRVLIPCSALGVACLSVTFALTEKSMGRETEAAKAQLLAEKEAGVCADPVRTVLRAVPQNGGRSVLTVRTVFLLLAAALIAAGVLNGGLEDVLTKANAICMECIGIG
jgi:hypothetical protein